MKLEAAKQENKILSERKDSDPELIQQLRGQIEDKAKDIQSLNDFNDTLVEEAESLRQEKVKWLKEKKTMEKEISTGKARVLESDQKAQSAALARAAAEEELNSAYQLKHAEKVEKEEAKTIRTCADIKEGEKSDLDPSQVCLFELKEPGLCHRKKKCKFEHEIAVKLRNDTEFIQKVIDSHSNKMGFCAVEFVSKGICNADECRYNHVIEHSNLRIKKPEPNENQETNHKRVCYKELLEKDSCPFGKDRCRFLHEFPESLRNDTDFIQKKLDERKMRQALCVNEYVRRGGCKKGENADSTTISQRNNVKIQIYK